MAKENACAACNKHGKKPKWYKDKTVIAFAALSALVVCSYIFSFLAPFRNYLFLYAGKIWWAILLGLVFGGVIDYFVPREYISHILAKPKKRTVIYSVGLGFMMSVCSHGILAISMELHKKGASNPAVVSFLLASPWANLPITIMLFGFFGLKALYIIVSALIVALTTGFIYQILERKKIIETNQHTTATADDFSITGDIVSRFKTYKAKGINIFVPIKGIFSGIISLADMILWWLIIGMVLASLSAAYVPSHIFKTYMGPTLLGMVVTLLLATILEVCSEGTAPLAFEIYRQTKAMGNTFVFLMGGVITDYTEIGLLWANVGRKVAIFLPIVTIPQVIILGMLGNILFK
ncbi:MAG: permease [Candidatus Omnitrophica bacterium]|nr:permease [Candidatus Omnitrophota bacterium]